MVQVQLSDRQAIYFYAKVMSNGPREWTADPWIDYLQLHADPLKWLHCDCWKLWCILGVAYSFSRQNRGLHFIIACWEFPSISSRSWPPALHCMCGERVWGRSKACAALPGWQIGSSCPLLLRLHCGSIVLPSQAEPRGNSSPLCLTDLQPDTMAAGACLRPCGTLMQNVLYMCMWVCMCMSACTLTGFTQTKNCKTVVVTT